MTMYYTTVIHTWYTLPPYTLNPEVKDIKDTMLSNIGPTWFAALQPEFSKQYFIDLCCFLHSEIKSGHTICPRLDQVFSFTRMCSIDQIKVVIVGNSPFHQPGQANGLAFSVPFGMKIPPSTMNIFKEIQRNFPGYVIPNHGDLTSWVQQGVLLMNSYLTVRGGENNSHRKIGWEILTNAIIKYINDNSANRVVFMLFGRDAETKAPFINGQKHLMLTTSHPSPGSAYRGFNNCQYFQICNHLLHTQGTGSICWGSNTSPPPVYNPTTYMKNMQSYRPGSPNLYWNLGCHMRGQ